MLVCIDKFDGSVEYYDCHKDQWISSPFSLQLPITKILFELELLDVNINILYTFGGSYVYNELSNKVFSHNFSVVSPKWSAMAPMKQKRIHFCSLVLNDTIYALGGLYKSDGFKFQYTLDCCERYDRLQNSWSTIKPLTNGRYGASAALYNNCIFIAGGMNEDKTVLQSVEKYNPQSNTWSFVKQMTTARTHFALTPFNGRLWAIGGQGCAFKTLSTVESYDPVKNEWQEERPLNYGRINHAAREFNGNLYVVGGYRKVFKNGKT